MFNADAMRAIAVDLYHTRVEQIYGSEGIETLKDLLSTVNAVLSAIPFEAITEGVTIVSPIDPNANPVPLEGGVVIDNNELASRFKGSCTLQRLATGGLRFWPTLLNDFSELSQVAVIYHYCGGDFFFLEGTLTPVPNPTGFPSAFGIPTFVDLERALRYYSMAMAKQSTCQILQACWYDTPRFLLKNRPEMVMRKSLAQFLRSTLRDHSLVEIREEQNMDESKPVDIKITWSQLNRIAIIEVKWLGYSVSIDASHISTSWTTDKRAQDGAKQLADYLEDNLERAPMHVTRGYLVVFDARRRGVKADVLHQNISDADARFYENVEISYSPQYEESRRDFALPLRFYLAPRDLNTAGMG
jgi:hypothetical protein